MSNGLPEDPAARAQLRRRLRERYPWLGPLRDIGPQTVDAGECDRCGTEPRMVAVCGPVPWGALGRRCAADVGADAWCDGHRSEGRRHIGQLASLPPEADTVARMWWVATGEVRPLPLTAAEIGAVLGEEHGGTAEEHGSP